MELRFERVHSRCSVLLFLGAKTTTFLLLIVNSCFRLFYIRRDRCFTAMNWLGQLLVWDTLLAAEHSNYVSEGELCLPPTSYKHVLIRVMTLPQERYHLGGGFKPAGRQSTSEWGEERAKPPSHFVHLPWCVISSFVVELARKVAYYLGETLWVCVNVCKCASSESILGVPCCFLGAQNNAFLFLDSKRMFPVTYKSSDVYWRYFCTSPGALLSWRGL